MHHWIVICSLMLLAFSAHTSQAQEFSDQPAPTEVLATMPSRAVSVLFARYPIGAEHREVMVHVYAIPEANLQERTKVAYRRKQFMALDVPKCRFAVDFFLTVTHGLRRLNRVTFRNTDGVNGIQIKWLEPKSRRGPIIALHIGTSHWPGWELIAFPDGIQSPATLQYFGYGGEGGDGIEIKLDTFDTRGRMTIREDWTLEGKSGVKLYRWDGVEFADHYRPFFVIAASLKTRDEAQKFCIQHPQLEEEQVRPSGHYPRLVPGYFLVINYRYEKRKDALEGAAWLRKTGIHCYVKRAF